MKRRYERTWSRWRVGSVATGTGWLQGWLRAEGWVVNHKRVERIWREEGLKVPKKQPVKSRVVCKSERKLLDASVRLPWRPPSVREA